MGAQTPAPPRLGCLVVEQAEYLLELLASLLFHEGWTVVGRARTGTAGLAVLEQQDAHMLLVADLVLPDMSGIELTRRAVEVAGPAVSVVLFAAAAGRSTVERALAAGARGFVLNDALATELVSALAVVGRGGTYVDPRLGHEPEPAGTY
jgi:DNA-binding NarL/FixJ family response regulator